MALGVRLEPDMDQQLSALAQRLQRSRSSCVRDAIQHYLQQFPDPQGAREQSQRIAALESEPHWSESVPDWSHWSA